MKKVASKAPQMLKPPYGNVTWYRAFFELIRSRSFEKFDTEIIEINIVKKGNSSRLFNGLRFLGLVEKDGTVTEKFKNLRITGDEFKQRLRKCVEEAYNDLFSKASLESMKPEQLQNYFIEKYEYGISTANSTIKVFKYLCQEAGIPLSQELIGVKTKPKKATTQKKPQSRQSRRVPSILDGMHQIVWGDSIVIGLRKGDRSTREKIAEIAKNLIDTYVTEEE